MEGESFCHINLQKKATMEMIFHSCRVPIFCRFNDSPVLSIVAGIGFFDLPGCGQGCKR